MKNIYKILLYLDKKYEELGLKYSNKEKEIKEYHNNRLSLLMKRLSKKKSLIKELYKNKAFDSITFGEKFKKIKKIIAHDIKDCNIKDEKEILILIDLNIYNTKLDDNLYEKTYIIDSFIEQTKLILNEYLSSSDRLGVLIYINDYEFVCPLTIVDQIDANSFSKDLLNFKNKMNDDSGGEETDDYYLISDNFQLNDYDYNSLDNEEDNDMEESSDITEKIEKIKEKIKGLIKSINYLINYSKMKGSIKKDKYIILFSDIINNLFIDSNDIEEILTNLTKDPKTVFLLVGKNNNSSFLNSEKKFIGNDKKFEELIFSYFAENSEVIEFENMKKIKTILSNNNALKDEIIFPNEIYK